MRSRWLYRVAIAALMAVAMGAASPAAAVPSRDASAGDVAVEQGPLPSVTTSGALTMNGSTFNPALIISDSNFYDSQAMSAAAIKSFLDERIGVCNNGKCLNVIRVTIADQPKLVSSSTGNLICNAMQGGEMTAATLIYRVQVACGISAKVILVTLQKEQGLTTSKAPSDWNLRAAMGMACPDTAPCDSAYSGLAVQIYTGAAQLKKYMASRFARQPGVHQIQLHPNASCGTKTIDIQNYATAALYNYTPYTPNKAALENPRGTGDACSSYGNRNFWVFYNDWFGSPTDVPFSQAPQPWIEGDPEVGATLTSYIGTWTPWPTTSVRQWLRDGEPIAGADASTYVITEADDGHTLTFQFTAMRAGRHTTVRTSEPVLLGDAFETAPDPTWSGDPEYGATLVADPGAWVPTPTSLVYQWLRNGAPISGATAPSYTSGPADRGAQLAVRVTATKEGYVATSRTSSSTPVLLDDLTPSTTYHVAVPDDGPLVGQTLNAKRGTWFAGSTALGEDSEQYFSYQWLRNGVPLTGQTSKSYLTRGGDLGNRISVQIRANVPGFRPLVVTTAETEPVLQLLTAPTPGIDGVLAVGHQLTADTEGWTTGATLTYQWYRSANPIGGASASTYIPVAGDVGHAITVRVSGTKTNHVDATVTSAPTAPILSDAVDAATPEVLGSPTIGETLTADAGEWGPTGVELTHQWMRSGVEIPFATGPDYSVVAGDAGHEISVEVTGSSSGLATVVRESAPVGPVGKPLSPVTPAVSATTALAVGGVVSAKRGNWTADGVQLSESNYSYQWLRDGEAIPGAVAKDYRLTAADSDASISVQVTGSYPGFSTTSSTSTEVGPVRGLAPTGPNPVIGVPAGGAVPGAWLTVKRGQWMSGVTALPESAFTYTWYRDGVAVRSGKEYPLKLADLGADITVKVTATVSGYPPESKTSAAVAIVQPELEGAVPRIVAPAGGTTQGSWLVVKRGQWWIGEALLPESVFSYTWYRDGVMVRTGKEYPVKLADRGAELTVVVTATVPGYDPLTFTSDVYGPITW